jgi:hypothetical protein
VELSEDPQKCFILTPHFIFQRTVRAFRVAYAFLVYVLSPPPRRSDWGRCFAHPIKSSTWSPSEIEPVTMLPPAEREAELLSIVLGMKPSAETDRLHREIVAGQSQPPSR